LKKKNKRNYYNLLQEYIDEDINLNEIEAAELNWKSFKENFDVLQAKAISFSKSADQVNKRM
jgi:hypothetical protein